MTLTEVLGSSGRHLPRAYVERPEVDGRLRAALGEGTHIALFGTSGVGKTALVQRHVDASRLLFVQCLPGQRVPEVYRAVLAEAGARVRTETRLSRRKRLTASLRLISGGAEQGTERTETEVTIDLGHVGDVFRTLAQHKSRPLIVLHDFHLLPRGTQRQLIGDFQYTFERTEVRVIVVGNWSSSAYLSDLNERLPSFMSDVKVTAWSDGELAAVIGTVERLLNVSLSDDVKALLIAVSAGSIRELIETFRLLLTGLADGSRPASVTGTERLQKIVQFRVTRLFTRYRELASSYLTTRCATTEGVDLDRFLAQIAGDILDVGDDDSDEEDSGDEDRESYSLDELKEAFALVLQEHNQPRMERQRRRRLLIERLSDAGRRDGSEVAVALESVVGDDESDPATEMRRFRAASRALVRMQARAGFHPPLVAFDPHARTLVALEPKFRAFLRTGIGAVEELQQDTPRRVDERRFHGYRTSSWHDPILETARFIRWRNRNVQVPETGVPSS
jgi:hypothetical protein